MNIFEEAAGTGRKTSKETKAKSTSTSTKARSTSTKAKGARPKSKKCKGGHDDAGRAVTDTMMPMMGLGLGMAMMDGLFN